MVLVGVRGKASSGVISGKELGRVSYHGDDPSLWWCVLCSGLRPGPCTLKLSSPYEDTVSGGRFPLRVALFLAFLVSIFSERRVFLVGSSPLGSHLWSWSADLSDPETKIVRLSFFGHSDVKTTRDAACSFRSFSFGVEHSCLFLSNKSLVRVLSEPSRDVNGTYEVESVCLVFHLIRELRSEGLKISTAIVKLGHT